MKLVNLRTTGPLTIWIRTQQTRESMFSYMSEPTLDVSLCGEMLLRPISDSLFRRGIATNRVQLRLISRLAFPFGLFSIVV